MSTLATETIHQSTPSPFFLRWVTQIKPTILSELCKQLKIGLPLVPMNSTWFAKTAITTAFLGRLGELQLAAGTLGFTFANVTGFSILNGLCWAMESVCGRAHGAKNRRLLHKTLLMATILLLVTSIPISFLWIYIDKILIIFRQQRDISLLAKRYVMYLLPDLVATSFYAPLKTYLSSQGKTLPMMFSSAIALAFHVPFNVILSHAMGIEGVALAIGLTDICAVFMLALYLLFTEKRFEEGWWKQTASDWARLLRLALPCCFTGCLEWWCYEILILLSGRMPQAKRSVAVLNVVLNFDYLFYGALSSLATCASTRVSNELGAGNPRAARTSASISLGVSAVTGLAAGLSMVALKGQWGCLFSHEEGVVDGVKKLLLWMALVEVFNLPLGTCGGILRGTCRPWLGMFSVGGFYLVGLPSSVVLAFKVGLGLSGLVLGFSIGCAVSAGWLCVFIARVDWDAETKWAQNMAASVTRCAEEGQEVVSESK